jgi:hypothetical protein
MPISITGAKYPVRTISVVGTTTVTIASPTWDINDFIAQRIVGLWSAASVFKGFAYIRRFITNTQFEIEKEIFDPATGLTVTQVVGDQILISKNYADGVQAGLAVSGPNVTLTDVLTIGSNTALGVCFYDEDKTITTNQLSTNTAAIGVSGGLVVHGHLDDYATQSFSAPCTLYYSGPTAFGLLFTGTGSAFTNQAWYGGRITTGTTPEYLGNSISTAQTWIFSGISSNCDFITLAPFTNPARCQVINIKSVIAAANTIGIRWSNGVQRGCSVRVPRNSASPISALGDDNAGTYSINGFQFLDNGNNVDLWRAATAVTQTLTIANYIGIKYGMVGNSKIANPNGTSNYTYTGTFLNLVAGTVGAITLDADVSLVDSNASTSASWLGTVLRKRYVGLTESFTRGPWTYGFKKYGYGAVGGAIVASTFDLGADGISDNVVFGGLVNQVAQPKVTLSQSSANALTSIGTADDFYDASFAWSCFDVTNARYPNVTTYFFNDVGSAVNIDSRNLIVNNGAASAFAVNTSTNTITVKSPTIATGAKFSSITTTGTITLTTQASAVGSYAALSAATIALSGGTNYQSLTASTAITGLPTTGVISAAGALGLGSSTITATGNLSISNTALSGTLTISTATARTLTLTSITGSVTVNVTGGGTLTVVLAGTTAANAVTTGAGVTKAVQCSLAINGGNTFNLVKRYGTTGAYTDLGYTAGITSDSFLVPLGQPVEVAIWTLGYLTFTRTIQTTDGGFDLLADMIPEPDVDTTLDVSSYLSNIAVTYADGSFTATFNANMDVPGIEPAKAILHRLLGLEGTMRALLPPGMSTTVDVEPDEIQINKPSLFLVLGAGATNVNIAGFFNTGPAKVIDPAYIINPRRVSDNLRVEIPLVKPALDVAAMAAAVWSATTRTLTSGGGGGTGGGGATLAEIEASTVLAKQATLTALATTNQAEHDATQTAIAALPAPLNSAQTQAAAAAALVAYDAVVPADLASLATAANVSAAQTAVVAEVNANEAKLDTLQTTATAIQAKTDALSNGPTAAAIRTELETAGGKLDETMKAAKAAKRQTL